LEFSIQYIDGSGTDIFRILLSSPNFFDILFLDLFLGFPETYQVG